MNTPVQNVQTSQGPKHISRSLTDFVSDVSRLCPSCLSTRVISKGKQAKTGEVRGECKVCGKQFALLFSENLAKMSNDKDVLGATINKLMTTISELEYRNGESVSDKSSSSVITPKSSVGDMASSGFSCESVLRGGVNNHRKLCVLYFSNIRRNNVKKIKEAITGNTNILSSNLVNIDFAEDGILEVFCWTTHKEKMACALAKLDLILENYCPIGSKDLLHGFRSRMERIYRRKGNTNTALKRYALKLSKLTETDLETCLLDHSGSDTVTSVIPDLEYI